MISFYPGPSKIYPEVASFMQKAAKAGILSVNHRSEEFVDLSKKTITLLKKKLNIPANYSVFFTSSATECWEIIAQSLTQESSFHIFNGAFGQKWFEYAYKIRYKSIDYPFLPDSTLDVEDIFIPLACEIICITQNETSNGSQITDDILVALNKKFPEKLIAVDATSSLAGIDLNIAHADIWFASVQKCFGLPAGMSILICSPRAIKRAEAIHENLHYNSLSAMIERMNDWQTTYTPNVLSIYLLYQTLQITPVIKQTDKIIKQRAEKWYEFVSGFKSIQPMIVNSESRSRTVICVTGDQAHIKKIKASAKKAGITLGNGYGKWAKNTFRIANFPAISEKEITTLKKFLKQHIK
ncbi:MAG: aminotransferase class V-fold PLP-dependent enzyme [Cytophagaceae bacterium]|nr:aminotransferase class V-fold PLP-dependent enzyme [Cytophagaceae bacterium]